LALRRQAHGTVHIIRAVLAFAAHALSYFITQALTSKTDSFQPPKLVGQSRAWPASQIT